MLIVHVVRQFHPGVGGLETVVLELASAQVKAGHRVRVVTLDRLFNVAAQAKATRAGRCSTASRSSAFPISARLAIRSRSSVLRHIKDADLVHVHAIDFFFDYLAWTKPLHGRKLVVSTHGGFFHTQYAARLKRVWFQTVTRLSLKFYAGVAAVSASDFERFSAIRPHGLVCIENGANVSTFRDAAADRLPEIDHFARTICQEQAHRPADRILRERFGDTTPNGDSRLPAGREICRPRRSARWSRHAGLSDAIDVVASPTDEAVKTLMRNSSFVASSSEYEGFGVAAVEGMSAGLFPLLSEIPPFRRLIARTGLGIDH